MLVGGKEVCANVMYNTMERILQGKIEQLKFHLNVKNIRWLVYVDYSENYETRCLHRHNGKLLSESMSILLEAKSQSSITADTCMKTLVT